MSYNCVLLYYSICDTVYPNVVSILINIKAYLCSVIVCVCLRFFFKTIERIFKFFSLSNHWTYSNEDIKSFIKGTLGRKMVNEIQCQNNHWILKLKEFMEYFKKWLQILQFFTLLYPLKVYSKIWIWNLFSTLMFVIRYWVKLTMFLQLYKWKLYLRIKLQEWVSQ